MSSSFRVCNNVCAATQPNRKALEKIGFAIVTGHGVAEALISEAHARIEPFFRETGEESKLRFAASRHGSVNQG